MKKLFAAVAAAALLMGAPGIAQAGSGANPTIDQLCMNPAFVNGHHKQGGKHVNHHALCENAVHPRDYS